MPRRSYRNHRRSYNAGYNRRNYTSSSRYSSGYSSRYSSGYYPGRYTYDRYGLTRRRREYPWMRDLLALTRRLNLVREEEETEEREREERREAAEGYRRTHRRRNREAEEEEIRRRTEELRRREEKEEKERLERERAKIPLKVKDIDLHIKTNTELHKTDRYEVTQLSDGNEELVIRRGKEFKITLKFEEEYKKHIHDLEIIMKTGEKSSVPHGTMAVIEIEANRKDADPKKWHAWLHQQDKTNTTVYVHPPANCIIGEWQMEINTRIKKTDGDNKKLAKYEMPSDINIILNPWCKEDTVYMEDDDYLKEFILNDKGVVFQGSSRYIGAKIWHFDQFEEGILENAFDLLRKYNNLIVDSKMGDPIHIARAISSVVNSSDNNGVLTGNWSGNYSGGTKPTAWAGSAKILNEYKKSKSPVKYGQCWVFSGVTTTVCRALGLPCKSVTCFDSAHDTDGNTTIDEYYRRKEDDSFEPMEWLNNDSIWNFHVWNEVFMARPDIPGDYGGWQVIDATPQEASLGVYRCGPSPLKAIKEGNCSMPYDVPFVFAEVNSNVVKWEYIDSKTHIPISVEKQRTGKYIFSKFPDGLAYKDWLTVYNKRDSKHNVTDDYKYPEGSNEEKRAVINAGRIASDPYHIAEVAEDVQMELVDEEQNIVGKDIQLVLKIMNTGDVNCRIKNMHLSLSSKKYNGEFKGVIMKKHLTDMDLQSNGEKYIKEAVETEVYLDKLAEQANITLMLSATIESKVSGFCYNTVFTEDFRLRRPDLDVKAPHKCKIGEKIKMTVSFTNPLPKDLTECVLFLDGAGFEMEDRYPQKNVKKWSEWKAEVTITAKRKGVRQIVATFDCKEQDDVTGRAEIEVC